MKRPGLYARLELQRAYTGLTLFWAVLVVICLVAYIVYLRVYPDIPPPPRADNQAWQLEQEGDMGRNDVKAAP